MGFGSPEGRVLRSSWVTIALRTRRSRQSREIARLGVRSVFEELCFEQRPPCQGDAEGTRRQCKHGQQCENSASSLPGREVGRYRKCCGRGDGKHSEPDEDHDQEPRLREQGHENTKKHPDDLSSAAWNGQGKRKLNTSLQRSYSSEYSPERSASPCAPAQTTLAYSRLLADNTGHSQAAIAAGRKPQSTVFGFKGEG